MKEAEASSERRTLTGKLVSELQTIAEGVGVKEVKKLKKAQLIDAILAQVGSGNGKESPETASRSLGGQQPGGEGSVRTPVRPERTDDREEEGGDLDPQRERRRRRRGRGRDRGTDRGLDRERGGDRGLDRERGGDRGLDRERGGDRTRERARGRDREEPEEETPTEVRTGILDILPDGWGFLRTDGYLPSQEDVYVGLSQVRRFHLRRGDVITGTVRRPKAGEKYKALTFIESINSVSPEEIEGRPAFDRLTPYYPTERLPIEVQDNPKEITQRIIDLIAPIGKGQRGMIVSPPKAGKTTVMKQIANSVRANNPEVHLMILLVDERPEEVTDMQRSVEGAEIIYSTFDRPLDDHIQVTELSLDRAKRLVELGRDVVILLDGITRLARSYNLALPASGRILTGGIDSTALHPPKRFFGAARNIDDGGSLTILATALVETGSRMDEVIFEEFKGTGNWELRLDRRASEKRLFPALDIEASGTRKEELLLAKEELAAVWKLRRVLHALQGEGLGGLEMLIDKMRTTAGNAQFLREIATTRGVD